LRRAPRAGKSGTSPSRGFANEVRVERCAGLTAADARWKKLVPAVREFIGAHPGCTGRDLATLTGRERDITAAARWLEATGDVRYEAPPRRGLAGRWHPAEGGVSQVSPGASGRQVSGGVSHCLPAAYAEALRRANGLRLFTRASTG
jgi:hypothetical protein